MNTTGKIKKITYISLGVAILAVCSWISIPIGSVPFTMQTFALTTLIMILGTKDAMISLIVYILLGITGLPVYAGFTGGISVFMTPAGGFLIGFIPMVLVSGLLLVILPKGRIMKVLAAEAGILGCYLCGVVYTCALFAGKNQPIEMGAVLMMTVVPYIIPDIVKNVVAVMLGEKIKPIILND